MRAVLIAVATLLAVPALAQGGSDVHPPTFGRPGNNPGYPPPNGNPGNSGYGNSGNAGYGNPGNPPNGNPGNPPNGNPGTTGYPVTPGTPVVVDRDTLMQQLANINDKLAQASVRAKKDRQQQKQLDDARAELKEVARLVTTAPLAQQQQPQRPPPPQSPPPPQPSVQPITEALLRSLVTAVRNEPFADDQLNVLSDAATSQYFLVSQTQQLLSLFSFSKDRLKALRLVRPHLLDPENGFKLYESFEFAADKQELKRILASQTP
jgi:hypothetical protein